MDEVDHGGYDVIRQTRMRSAIGRRMKQSVAAAPHVTLHRRCSARALLAARHTGERAPVSVSALLAVVVVSRTLLRHPGMNGVNVDGELRRYAEVNLGVAVAVDGGLVVPVLADCASRSVQDVSDLLRTLVERSRTGQLSPQDLGGGTFTITNLGSFGVEYFTPIINQPQLAILGIGAVTDQPIAVGGVVVVEPMLYLSLSIDHSVLDGAPAARFLADLAQDIGSVRAAELVAT